MTSLNRAIAACVASTVIVANATASAEPPRNREADLPTYLLAEADGFVVVYHPALGDRVRAEVDALPAMRRELEAELGTPVLAHVDLEVTVGSHEALDGASRTRVILPSESAHDADAVRELIRFELARQAIREASGDGVPPWFERAYAARFSGRGAADHVVSMTRLTLQSEVPPLAALSDLDDDRCDVGCESETAAARDFVRFVSSREDALARAMTSLRDGTRDFEDAISDATRIPTDSLNKAWQHESSGRHWLIAAICVFAVGAFAWLVARVADRLFRRRSAGRQVLLARRRRKARSGGRQVSIEDAAIAASARVEVPRIEHDGSWHTLH